MQLLNQSRLDGFETPADNAEQALSTAAGIQQETKAWITRNPLISIVMAIGVGAGLGWLLKTRH